MITNSKNPKILVLALSGIGNLLMATPVFRLLKEKWAGCKLTVIVAPRGTKEVLAHNPFVSEIWVEDIKYPLIKRFALIKKIRKGNFDLGIITYPGQSIESAEYLYFGKVKRRIGHQYRYRFLKHLEFLLTDALPVAKIHDVEQNLQLLKSLGITHEKEKTHLDFFLDEESKKKAQSFLQKNNLLGKKLIGFHPGSAANMAYKRWEIEKFAQLADKLSKKYQATSLIFGGKEESPIKEKMQKLMSSPALLVDKNLTTTAAIIKNCFLFISNDSGLMHVAVSQNVPTFGIFGPTDFYRTSPWGKFGHVIKKQGLPCQPCYNVDEPFSCPRNLECLKKLTVEEALAQIKI